MKISYKLVLALLFLISCESEEKVSEDLANKFLEEGNAAFKNKEITTAIKKLELAAYYAENSNQKEGITYNLAYTYYLSSDYERALDILNGLTIKRRVLFLKGLCLYNLAMFNSSIEVFNEAKALNTDKNNHDLKIWIANGYSGLQQYGKAIEILLEVIESADNEANKYHALQNLGYVYLHTRQYDEAIEILSQAIELEKDLMSQINLADAYRLKVTLPIY
jgi:tetratricopeptide (TPR) repeat protein